MLQSNLFYEKSSLEKNPMLGKTKGKRGRGWQRMRWLDRITKSMDMNLSKLGDNGGQRSLMGHSLWGGKELDSTSN